MKKLLLTSFLFAMVFQISGQEKNNYENQIQELDNREHVLGEFVLSGSPNIMFNYPFENIFAGGLKISLFVSEHISFDSDIIFGKNYFHFGPGIIGLPLWLAFFSPRGLSLGNEDEEQPLFLFYQV